MNGNVILSGTLGDNNLYSKDKITSEIPIIEKEEKLLAVENEIIKNDNDNPDTPKPYTWKDRIEVMGSRGTTRSDSTAGLNIKQILHRRLGHPSESTLEKMLKNNTIIGAGRKYNTIKNMKIGICDACIRAKMRRNTVCDSNYREKHNVDPLSEIAIDPVPMIKNSIQGNKWSTIGIDIATSYAFAIHSKTKDVQCKVIDDIKYNLAEKYNKIITKVHTDMDSVYTSYEFKDKCQKEKIQIEHSSPYIHEENGIVERLIRTLSDMTRTALYDANMSPGFGEYALNMQIVAYNYTIHPESDIKSPYEKLTGNKPDISILRPFGAYCWYHVNNEERIGDGARWIARAEKGRIVGYANNTPGSYLVMTSIVPLRIKIRRDVVVAEGSEDMTIKPMENRQDNRQREKPILTPQLVKDRVPPDILDTVALRRSDRTPIPNRKYAEADAANIMPTVNIPNTVYEAINGSEGSLWMKAIESERDNFCTRSSLKPVTLDQIPAEVTILDLKPVFAKRPEENGGFKYKFRLAVRGFAQKYGIDFDETYSPTVQFNTVKVILHLAAHYNWESYHLDVGCAYMEAPPERRLFVKVSKAYEW